MERVFITGASGFLGRYLLKFAPRQAQILAQYRNSPVKNAPENVRQIQMDLTDPDWSELIRFNPDVIIHAAAQASIDECELNPDLAWEVNYHSTCKLAGLAKSAGSRFVYISSDVIFDGKKGDYQESDPPAPLNVYAETKVASEKYVLDHLENAVVVRPALFYGVSLNGRPSFTEIMMKNLRSGKPVYLFTDQYRTPILINNLASALWEVCEVDFRGIIHLAGSQKLTRFEMGKILCDLFKLPSELIIPIKAQESRQVARRPLDCSLDISLAKQVLKTQLVDCRYGLYLAFQ